MTTEVHQPFPLVAWLDRRSPLQRRLIAAAVVAVLGFKVVRWAASSLLDRWWFAELGASDTWSRKFWAQVLLVVVAGALSTAVMLVSNRFALRTRPPEDQPIFRPVALAAGRLGPARVWLAYAVPVALAAIIASAASTHWEEWLLFTEARDLGVEAPEVGFDLSYHLFRLPLLSRTTAWLMALLATCIAMAVVLYVLQGCLRLPIAGRGSSPRAVRHLAVLGGAWMVVRAIDYWFVKYPGLASSSDGRFDGAGYALMHGPGIAYRPLAIASAMAAVLLFAFAVGRSPVRFSASAVTVTLATHAVLVLLVPAVVQRIVVLPAEGDREARYIAANLAATRSAYALETVDVDDVRIADGVSPGTESDRVPIFDVDQLAGPFHILQGTRGTRLADVDLDRYRIDGRPTPVYIGSRDAAIGELPETGWVQQHLVYTHGDGVVATQADRVASGGGLAFTDLGTELGLSDPAVYFGPRLDDWFALVGTKRVEAGGSAYSSDNGVDIDSTWRRVVAGLALSDVNVVVSSELTSATQLLYRRSLTERIGALAPFLTVDGDPYPVISDGHIVWIVNAYTTSKTYPYAQFAAMSGVPASSPLHGRRVNYVHQSAVVTVDALDGTTHIYRRDSPEDPDPILDIWDRILPDLLETADSMPDDVAEHLTLGEDGFTVQTNMLALYHVDDAETLFNGTDAWLVSQRPGATLEDEGTGPAPGVSRFDGDDAAAAWSIYRAYSPGAALNPSSGREDLAALAVGDHTTGRVRVVEFTSADGRLITSPAVAQSAIEADPEVSQLFALLNANGSKVTFGPMTPVLTADGLAWVRSVIVTTSSTASIPRLHSVLAVSNGEVGVGDTVNDALAATASG